MLLAMFAYGMENINSVIHGSVFSKVCWTPVSLKVDYRIDIPIHNGQTVMIKKEFASKTNTNVSQLHTGSESDCKEYNTQTRM